MEVVDRTVAGRYRLLEPLGSGGMGTVWRAQDVLLGRDVAVKEVTFPAGVSESEREILRERTRREARAAARLDHPSVATVYDVAEENGTPFLVMELVQARTLAEVVRTDGPLSPAQTATIGLAVLGALQAAHEQGIVHRDVKPSNVLLRADGRVVLTDFGIATFAGDSSLTSTGLVLGSPSYMAPERARGEAPGPASDLWSLGATLFTAVEGRPPYDRGEPLPTLTAVLTGDHEPYLAAGPLAPVLDGLLTKEPDQRLDAAGTRRALEDVIAIPTGEPAARTAVLGPAPPEPAPAVAARRAERTTALNLNAVSHRARGRRRVLASLTLAGLAAALVVGLFLLLHAGTPTGARQRVAGRTGTSTGPSTRPSTGAAGSSPQATGTGSGTSGWPVHSGDGWSVAVPPSYAESSFLGSPQYKDPTTGRTLRVTTTPPGGGKADPVLDRRQQAASFASSHSGYREISIAPTSFQGHTAADWEFTYYEGGVTLHVLNRVFVVAGRGYSLYFQTRSSDDWAAARADFDRIAASFRP